MPFLISVPAVIPLTTEPTAEQTAIVEALMTLIEKQHQIFVDGADINSSPNS